MLTGLYLHNFKAFDELRLDLKPITVILGPNNSGKSSIFSGIRMLVQTIESLDPDVSLLFNGIMGDFGTYKDVVYRNHRGRPFEIGFSVPARITKSVPMQSSGLDLKSYWRKQTNDILELKLSFKYRVKRRELILASTEQRRHRNKTVVPLLKTQYSEDTERQSVFSVGKKEIPPQVKRAIARYFRLRNFIPSLFIPFSSSDALHFRTDSNLSEFFGNDYNRILKDSSDTRSLSRALENTEYIGAMRVPPSRLYSYSGERRRRVGASGENAANILAMDQSRSGAKSNKIASSVSNWLSQAQIASDFIVEPTSDSFYEIRVQHPETKEFENLADVGLGNSQIMPILVGGYNLSAGSTYLVEEPEIHLHPRAQAELGSFFLDMYQNGVQSIIETHSEHLVLRLQQYVADQKISADDVQFYFVCSEQGKKVAKPLMLDEKGMFKEEWPGGFFPERLQEAKNLARIRAKFDAKH